MWEWNGDNGDYLRLWSHNDSGKAHTLVKIIDAMAYLRFHIQDNRQQIERCG